MTRQEIAKLNDEELAFRLADLVGGLLWRPLTLDSWAFVCACMKNLVMPRGAALAVYVCQNDNPADGYRVRLREQASGRWLVYAECASLDFIPRKLAELLLANCIRKPDPPQPSVEAMKKIDLAIEEAKKVRDACQAALAKINGVITDLERAVKDDH